MIAMVLGGPEVPRSGWSGWRALWWVKSEKRHLSSSFLNHCWCFSLLIPPFFFKCCLPCLWFSCSSFWGIWQDVLPIGCPFCSSCSLSCSFSDAFSLQLHPFFLTPLMFTMLSYLHKMLIHCVWLCHHSATKRLHAVVGYTILVCRC